MLEELERLAEESNRNNEKDNEIISYLYSKTKQENSESEEPLPFIRNSWHEKDGTKWSKTAGIRGRTHVHNLVTILLGISGPDRDYPPSSRRGLLIMNEMIQNIVNFTNLKISSTRQRYKCKQILASQSTNCNIISTK